MDSGVVGMGGEHKITSTTTPAICCLGTEKMALETPKVAIDAIEFQNLDSEDDVCRICQERANSLQRPLLQHCACKGSIGYVHKDCIEKWLDLRRAWQCEICKQDYPFTIPIFPERPEEDEYPFLLRLEIWYWLIPLLWVILAHIVVVVCTLPNGRSWVTDGLLGSIIYFLFFIAAYLIWYTLVVYVPGFMADAYYTDPFVWAVLERRDVRAATLNDLLHPYLFGDGVGDIGETTLDYMLAYKLYTIAIDVGAASFNYMESYVPYYVAMLGADWCFGRTMGTAHSEVIHSIHRTFVDHYSFFAFNDHYPDRKFWKAIFMMTVAPLTVIVWCFNIYHTSGLQLLQLLQRQ